MNKTIDILLLAAFTFGLGLFIGLNALHNKGGEEITEYQYREQSLQYLEDIRNKLDTQ